MTLKTEVSNKRHSLVFYYFKSFYHAIELGYAILLPPSFTFYFKELHWLLHFTIYATPWNFSWMTPTSEHHLQSQHCTKKHGFLPQTWNGRRMLNYLADRKDQVLSFEVHWQLHKHTGLNSNLQLVQVEGSSTHARGDQLQQIASSPNTFGRSPAFWNGLSGGWGGGGEEM